NAKKVLRRRQGATPWLLASVFLLPPAGSERLLQQQAETAQKLPGANQALPSAHTVACAYLACLGDRCTAWKGAATQLHRVDELDGLLACRAHTDIGQLDAQVGFDEAEVDARPVGQLTEARAAKGGGFPSGERGIDRFHLRERGGADV